MSGISAMFFGGTSYVFGGAWSVSAYDDYGGGLALGYDASSIPYVVLSGYYYAVGGTYGGRTFRVNTLRSTVWTRSTGTDVAAKYVKLDSSSNPVFVNNYDPNNGGGCTVMKLDTAGAVSWQRNLSNGVTYNDVQATGLAIDTSDNIYVCGNKAGAPLSFIAKYNSSGALQWQRELSTDSSIITSSIAVDASGNVIVGGSYAFSGANTYAHITKYNSSGTLQWKKYVNLTGFAYYTSIPAIVCDNSDNIYFCMHGGGTTANYNYFIKLDSSGAMQWTRRVATEDTGDTGGAFIDSDGYIYFCMTYDGGSYNTGTYIAKYDSSGTRQFDYLLERATSPYGVVVDNTGFMWVTGSTTDGTVSYIFLSRLPSDGPGSVTFSLGTPDGPITVTGSSPSLSQNTSALTISNSSLTDAAGSLVESAGTLTTGTFSTTAYTAP